MVARESIKSLRRKIAKERELEKRRIERFRLQTELRQLQISKKPSVRAGRKVAKAFRQGSKIVGKGLATQARRIADQQERQRISEAKIRKSLPKKVIGKPRRQQEPSGFDFMQPLDF